MARPRGPPKKPVIDYDAAVRILEAMPMKAWNPKKLVAYSGKAFKNAPKWAEVLSSARRTLFGNE